MIILSQKGKILNFDNIIEISTKDLTIYDEGCYVIVAETANNKEKELGVYNTKERAKELLLEIIKLYSEEDIYHIRKSELNSLNSLEEPKYIIKQIAIPKVYEMPEK